MWENDVTGRSCCSDGSKQTKWDVHETDKEMNDKAEKSKHVMADVYLFL
jgi:hypothetical protein